MELESLHYQNVHILSSSYNVHFQFQKDFMVVNLKEVVEKERKEFFAVAGYEVTSMDKQTLMKHLDHYFASQLVFLEPHHWYFMLRFIGLHHSFRLTLVEKKSMHFRFQHYHVYLECFEEMMCMKIIEDDNADVQYFGSYYYDRVGMQKETAIYSFKRFFEMRSNYLVLREVLDGGKLFRLKFKLIVNQCLVREFWLTLEKC